MITVTESENQNSNHVQRKLLDEATFFDTLESRYRANS